MKIVKLSVESGKIEDVDIKCFNDTNQYKFYKEIKLDDCIIIYYYVSHKKYKKFLKFDVPYINENLNQDVFVSMQIKNNLIDFTKEDYLQYVKEIDGSEDIENEEEDSKDKNDDYDYTDGFIVDDDEDDDSDISEDEDEWINGKRIKVL